jgi:hypothetical protein
MPEGFDTFGGSVVFGAELDGGERSHPVSRRAGGFRCAGMGYIRSVALYSDPYLYIVPPESAPRAGGRI